MAINSGKDKKDPNSKIKSVPGSDNIFDIYKSMAESAAALNDVLMKAKLDQKKLKKMQEAMTALAEVANEIGKIKIEGDLKKLSEAVRSMADVVTTMGKLRITRAMVLQSKFNADRMTFILGNLEDILKTLEKTKFDEKSTNKKVETISNVTNSIKTILKDIIKIGGLAILTTLTLPIVALAISELITITLAVAFIPTVGVAKGMANLEMTAQGVVDVCDALSALKKIPFMIVKKLRKLKMAIRELIKINNMMGRVKLGMVAKGFIATRMICSSILVVVGTMALIALASPVIAIGFLALIVLGAAVGLTILIFWLICKAWRYVAAGSLLMMLMSISLILFSVGLAMVAAAMLTLSWEGLVKFVIILAALIGVCILAGSFFEIAMLGTIALISLGGALAIVGLAMIEIATAMKIISTVKVEDDMFANIIRCIANGVGEVFKHYAVLNPVSLGLAMISIGMLTGVVLTVGVMAAILKDIASLKIPTEYDEKGKAKAWKTMTKQDFMDAASNVNDILVFFTSMFGEKSVTLNNGATITPINKSALNNITLSARWKIALLKGIVSSVGDMAKTLTKVASLKLPTDYDKNGKPTGYQQMTNDDFAKAAFNVADITQFFVGMFGEEPTTLHNGTSINPINKATLKQIDASTRWKFAMLNGIVSSMGSMAKTLTEVACLKVPTEYGDDGRAKGYHQMQSGDFMKAAINVTDITTFFAGMFADEPTILSDGTTLKPISKSALKTIDFSVRWKFAMLNGIVSSMGNMAKTLSDVALLKIPTEYDNDGKGVGWHQMTETDFAMAAINCGSIAQFFSAVVDDGDTTLENGMVIHGLNKDKLDGIGVKMAYKFKCLNSVVSTISNMAQTLQAVASLRMPVEFDEHGKATKYETMQTKDFQNAAWNTGAIAQFFAGLFGDGVNIKTSTGTVVADAIDLDSMASIFNLTSVSENMELIEKFIGRISAMSKPIMWIASYKFPTEFDSNGQVKSYVQGSDDMFRNAALNMSAVIKSMTGLFSAKPTQVETSAGSFTVTGVSPNIITQAVAMTSKVEKLPKLSKSIGKSATSFENACNINPKSFVNNVASVGAMLNMYKGMPTNAAAANVLDKQVKSTIKLLSKVGTLNTTKLTQAAKLMEQLAKFSKSINGNFDRLADSINKKLIRAVEKLNETLKKITEMKETDAKQASVLKSSTVTENIGGGVNEKTGITLHNANTRVNTAHNGIVEDELDEIIRLLMKIANVNYNS